LIKKLKNLFNRTTLQIWLGFSLSSLFFFPIASWLNGQIYYFHWNSTDTIELISSWILLGFVFSLGFNLTEKLENKFLKISTLSVLLFIPFSSYFLYLIKAVNIYRELILFANIIQDHRFISLTVLALFVFFILKKREVIIAIQYKLCMIFSFLNIYIIALFIGIIFNSASITPPLPHSNKPQSPSSSLQNIIFIVFDELSYQYLYKDRDIKEDYKNIKFFSDESNNYHSAFSPGKRTLVSIPSYIAGKKLDNVMLFNNEIKSKGADGKFEENPFLRENIFTHAMQLGYKTALVGWYHNYCEFLSNVLDFCDAYSIYKFVPKNAEFSIFHPFATNLILLPYRKPSGFLKIPVSVRSHSNAVKRILNSTKYAFENFTGALMFIHFPIPHKPFIFDGENFVTIFDAFTESDKNYNNQLMLVDKVFGEVLKKLKDLEIYDTSTIILTSDHNFRIKFDDEKVKQVPLLIKHRNQTSRIDVIEDIKVLDEFRRIIRR